MKRRLIIFSILSLALGIVITSLFTAQMTWNDYGDCASSQNQTLPPSIRRVDCAGLAYGFPFRFVQSKPSLDISFLGEPNTVPVLLGVNATTKINFGYLALNLIIWSALSGAVIGAIAYKVSRPKDLKEVSVESRK